MILQKHFDATNTVLDCMYCNNKKYNAMQYNEKGGVVSGFEELPDPRKSGTITV
jgi:hypothetical protein